MTAEVGTLH